VVRHNAYLIVVAGVFLAAASALPTALA